MLITVTEREFYQLMLDKEDVVSARLDYVAPTVQALATHWMGSLDAGAVAILVWLMGSTLLVGKAATRIPYRAFTEKLEDSTAQEPLSMSQNTVKKHLKTLSDLNIVTIYRACAPASGVEKEPRMFEIDCKTLLNTGDLERRNTRLLLDLDDKIRDERGQKASRRASKIGVPPTKKEGGSSYINSIDAYTEDGFGKPNLLSAVFDAPKVAKESNVLPVPKKKRTTAVRADTIDAVLSTQKVRRTAVAAARRDDAQRGELTTKTLQAVLDKAMADYLPNLPRIIVTGKPFGVFKKRIASASVDATKLAAFAIREWSTLAAQNRAAFLRDPSRAKKSAPLPPAPDFTTLAYRLPYFIAAFANNEVAGTVGQVEDAQQKEVSRLRKALAQKDMETRDLREVIRRTRRVTPAVSSSSIRPSTNDNASEDLDWTPPEWNNNRRAG